MQALLDKYPVNESPYLLPIIRRSDDERRQYLNAIHLVNRQLKTLSRKLGLSSPLTMYVARHSWASIARSKHIPLSVISEGMGHHSERTTQIYLASLGNVVIDRANSRILKGAVAGRRREHSCPQADPAMQMVRLWMAV